MAETKITYLSLRIFVVAFWRAYENILRFDVTVNYASLVDILEALEHVESPELKFFFVLYWLIILYDT